MLLNFVSKAHNRNIRHPPFSVKLFEPETLPLSMYIEQVREEFAFEKTY
jgi:hypothetical protein